MSAGERGLRVVAFGGGHGLHASLSALVALQDKMPLDIAAVVTVGDDGGSSGRLRSSRGVLPLGDLRQALAALAGASPRAAAAAELFQHRFAAPMSSGAARRHDSAPTRSVTGRRPESGRPVSDIGQSGDGLAGHAVGNLVLCGLLEMYGDPVAALDHAAALVEARGRVLPMSPEPVEIAADVRVPGGDAIRTVFGQHAVAVCPDHVEAVRITPTDPPACEAAVTAVRNADWLIFGPGSWYTSVIPHLLVPDLADAILESPARRVIVLNLAVETETHGLSLSDHVGALTRYLPGLHADVVLADAEAIGDPGPVQRAAESLGARLVLASVAADDGTPRHDPSALATALSQVLT
ncbi:MAG TPA: 2-phospho-L-lactate transferase CofD family protein [Micromonosporaceae bacterium]|nr:2-phospho-L-lactate transferase CofD family protein [Micromonosporaceae bacterium]